MGKFQRSFSFSTGLQVALLLDVVVLAVKTVFEISMALTVVKNLCEIVHLTIIEIGQISALLAKLYFDQQCWGGTGWVGPNADGPLGQCDLLYVMTMRRN